MKKNIYITLVGMLLTNLLWSQQDPQFTHYMYNSVYNNPAYAGSRDALTAGLLHRSQWIGLDGAPKSQTFYLHTPLNNERLNVGFSAVADKIGPMSQTMLYGDFAYRMPITDKIKIAFGIKAGVKLFQPRIAGLNTFDPNDPDLVGNPAKNSVAPNVGFGIYVNHAQWYAGVSAPRILENELTVSGSNTPFIKEKRHYFLIGGGIIPLNDMVKLKPSTQIKFVPNAPMSVDLTLEALVYDKFNFGFSRRIKDSFSLLAGMNINSQFHAGISWDFTTSDLRKVNDGSLELLLMYDFVFKKDKLITPRFF
jgi:type IX secretion system PorP/SprF family membrane protein